MTAEMTLRRSKGRRSETAATEEMIIRDATKADLPAIVDIYNAAVATRLSTAQLELVTVESRRDWLAEHSPDQYPFWILEMDGRVVAWLTFKSFLPRCAYRGTARAQRLRPRRIPPSRGGTPIVAGSHHPRARARDHRPGRVDLRAQSSRV